jgi:ABC-type transport system involved in multi-copper enzyme maturation permease subunit
MRFPILWKEWHEQRWRLAFGTAMLIGAIGSLSAAHIMSEREVLVILCGATAFVLPLFGAMGAFAPEHTEGTFNFYASRPARPFRVFMAKWFFGLMNVIAPVTAAFFFALLVSGRPLADMVFTNFDNLRGLLVSLYFGIIFYNMTCCFAPSKSREAFVGLIGLLVLLLMALYPMAQSYWLGDRLGWNLGKPEHPVIQTIILSVSPLLLFDPPHSALHRRLAYILYVEQGSIFFLVLWFGYWKWRRKW